MKTNRVIYVCLVVILCISAFADTVEIKYTGIDAGGMHYVQWPTDSGVALDGLRVMDTQNPSGPLASTLSDRIGVYCYELEQPDASSTSFMMYNVEPLADAIAPDKAELIAQLWELHYEDSWQSDTFIAGPVDTPENRAALALGFGIHEIIHDFDGSMASLNLSSGNFIAFSATPAAAKTMAQDWLDALSPVGQYDGPLAELVSLNHPGSQDYITELPEPVSMLLLGLGGLVLRKRRSMKA